MSEYTTAGKLQATLDFGFQQQGVDFAKGNPANVLGDFFAKDDWYTDADSNAYQLPTFLGNHDMGRASMFLKADGQSEAEHLKRVEFANSLMFTTRGNPVTYYGDEQGFVSTGGDQAAREDMFASKVDLYNTEQVLGGPEGSRGPVRHQSPALPPRRRALGPAREAPGPRRWCADRAPRRRRRRHLRRLAHRPVPAEGVPGRRRTTASESKTVTLDTWTRSKGLFKPLFGTRRRWRRARAERSP